MRIGCIITDGFIRPSNFVLNIHMTISQCSQVYQNCTKFPYHLPYESRVAFSHESTIAVR